MERKVGEIFEYNGEWYQCVEQPKQYDCATVCELCAFSAVGNCELDKCSGTYRSDSKSVIFKKLEKVGEPIRIENKSYQKIKVPDALCDHCAFYDNFSRNCKLSYYINHYPAYSCLTNEMFVEIKQNKENMEEKKLNYEELEHYYDSTCGLWAIDRNPKEVTLEWIVENAFQLGDATHEKACVSNLKPFDLEAAKHGKPVCIRDGRKVRIICFDAKCDKPIIALMYDCNEEFILKFLENGRAFADKIDKYDLMMLPEKKEGWVNIYKDFEDRICCIYKTKEEALEKKETEDDYITTVKIEWEE